MKNYQKNSRNPSVPFSCMLEQLMPTDQVKSIKWHLNNHIWSLNLNLVFKPTSFNLLLVALAQNTFILPCHEHASYCALHWLCFFLCCRYLSPLDRRDPMMWSLTLMKTQCYLQKCQASKTPLFIPIQSYSLAPALFYCIRTTPIHLLLAAVAEPLYPLHDLSFHSK